MIRFLPVDQALDDRGRMFYEVWRGTERLGYVLLPPFIVEGIDAALDIAMKIHAVMHPEESPS